MKLFEQASIKGKQLWIILMISALSLLLACAGITAYEVISLRASAVRNLSSLAEEIGTDASSGLAAKDGKTVTRALAVLFAEPDILGAQLYTADGKVFATYNRTIAGAGFSPPSSLAPQSAETILDGEIVVQRPIVSQGQTVGVIYLASDTLALKSDLTQFAGVTGLLFLLAMVLAWWLATRWQRLISDPIVQLAEVARAAAQDKNYSVRAPRINPDEIGAVADGFNELLARIQEWDVNLDRTVDHRTRQLQTELYALKHSEGQLGRERDLLRALLDNTIDLIYFKDTNSRFTDWSKSIEKCMGLPPDEIKGRTDHDFFPKEFADQFLKDEQEIMCTGRAVIGKLERNVSRDGRAEWMLTSKMPLRGRDGATIGTIGISRDVTAIKVAEASLEQAHRDLVDASRRAGMAEVATSVLHNVGNVLNSINISIALVYESVRNSEVKKLARLSALMTEHKVELTAFLTSDPRGRLVPEFVAQLTTSMEAEQAEWIKELELTRRNIEHVKEIVAMQQNYARASGVTEKFKAADLFEDALQMNDNGHERFDLRIIRDYSPAVPEITADKHKILQILVNLIQNAKTACAESAQSDKQLTLQVRGGSGSICFVVIDNGVGILRENMTRIFSHGFTTRENGHGFGLHNGALAAKQMGGHLTAESDGPATGARFTLEIPLTPG